MNSKFSIFLALAVLASVRAASFDSIYVPFSPAGYLTSSFGESRGTRYHAGIDYSTDMREGFPVIAPEDGKIAQVRTSPYGYGKVVYFKGKSGRTWVFAHQSGFSKSLDSLVRSIQSKKQRNDVSIQDPAIPGFRRGDTISFTGSSGIGNPHLHLEMRTAAGSVINPCRNSVLCNDTLDPFILGAAVLQGESVALSGESDLQKGCLEIPGSQNTEDSLRFVFKIADYSRYPLENPMSIRRITLKDGDATVGEVVKDTLSFSTMIRIREELLWAEEADTAGDWHLVPGALSTQKTLSDTLVLEVEDMVGKISTRKLAAKSRCEGQKPPMRGKFQDPSLFTFLSRTWIGLDRCDSGSGVSSFTLYATGKKKADLCGDFPHRPVSLGALLRKIPEADEIRILQNGKEESAFVCRIPDRENRFEWTVKAGRSSISQSISELVPTPWIRALAVKRLENDSVPAYEFHPKGLHFLGSWQVAFDSTLATGPLYYLGETTRRWFLFSKQQNEKRRRKAFANELRDIGFIRDTTAPEIGEIRLDSAVIAGTIRPVLRIPVIEKESGIENGNSIRANAPGKKFIYAEYDSEPREIVIDLRELPPAGKNFNLFIRDESGNRKNFEITVPEDFTAR